MKLFRKILFWLHLAAGLIAGLSIGIMCVTGAMLAFENEIVAWSERDVRRVTAPADSSRMSVDELLKKARAEKAEARPSAIVLSSDRDAAVTFQFGREEAAYANPYTGEVRLPGAPNRLHDFLQLMEDWHRVLALGGDHRPLGKAINGACNLAFFFLAVSGLYLWMPRSWSWRGVKAIALLNLRASGKARDFNWHNTIGLWSAPVLIVLTLTAVPISYRWGGNLIIRLSGETVPLTPPGQSGSAGGGSAGVDVPPPAPGARPLSYDALFDAVQRELPHWETISFRLGTANDRGAQRTAGSPSATASATAQNSATQLAPSDPNADRSASSRTQASAGSLPAESRERSGSNERRSAAQAVTVMVKEPGSWPRTATTTLSLNPFTGELLKREGYDDLPTSRQVRSWTRFLHTGQALGWVGQLVAGLACLGGAFLVYTGFALSWRRFFSKSRAGECPAPSATS